MRDLFRTARAIRLATECLSLDHSKSAHSHLQESRDQYICIESLRSLRARRSHERILWDGDDAYLSLTGTIRQMTLSSGEPLNYLVPSKNQCASCHATNHTTGELMPIGIKARHLDRTTALYNKNQLAHLAERGWLDDVARDSRANAVWEDTSQSLEHRARSYLDINCGHCHNAQGAADTSGLLLDYEDHPSSAMGWCKPPIAAGRGSGGLLYGIVPGRADESILSFRMTTNDPGMMMPELGSSLVHREGLALINDWIDSLEGQCL